MDYKELLEKYNLLLSENCRLMKENDRLKVQLEISRQHRWILFLIKIVFCLFSAMISPVLEKKS
jgi:hypothetical protein